MLTDPSKSQPSERVAMRGFSVLREAYIVNGRRLLDHHAIYQSREVRDFIDSVRLKTESPSGKRYAY